MNVGDYVRYIDIFNNTIKIRKINEIIPPDKLIKKDVYFFNNKECSLKEDIIKSSPNIIDLIEVGDYVNGYKVLEIEKDYLFDYREEINVLIVQNGEVYEVAKKIYSDDIKSIVTKEQFETMQYKVGE